jgi:UDP-N-acetylglucosamine--N-acetylmuramyl-(pentapeptide) pyrophosphoryl-undecaprenol N-acetylglucosamine transferase
MVKKRIMITGGGTGGHVYPALSIADALTPEYEISYVGSAERMEAKVVPLYGYPFYGISARPLRQFLGFCKSLWQAFGLVRKIKPDFVIGVGGFISFPVVFVAWVLRMPVILHEQNVIPGKVNRLFVRLGKPLMGSFLETAKYVPKNLFYYTGCLVREKIGKVSRNVARKRLGIDEKKKVCLIFGGSGGAAKMNDFALRLRPFFAQNEAYFLIHITGTAYFAKLEKRVKAAKNCLMIKYAENIEDYYAASDLVISRSGATTVGELLFLDKFAILIPSPNVKDNHQELNARYLEKEGQAKVVLEKDVVMSKIEKMISEFFLKEGF